MNRKQLSGDSYQETVTNSGCVKLLLRSLIVVLLLTVNCSLLTVHCSPLAVTRGAEAPLSREQRLQIFDDVWRQIDERYYDPNLRGLDWAAVRTRFREQAAEAATSAEFYHVLKQMVGSLRDSHTRVFAPEERSDWRNPRFISVGASVREIENQLVFTNVEKGSEAWRAGIKTGDLLASIDAVPASAVLERRMAEQTGASTPAMRRLRAVAGIFEGASDTFVRVGFQTARTKKIRFALLRREWRTAPPQLRARREGAVLIVAFDAFAPEIVRDFYQTLGEELPGARAIVLDLRNNRGGSTEAMTDVASAFLPTDSALGSFIDRAGKTEVTATTRGWLLYAPTPVKVPEQLPVVILTSTATASAAEIFTAALKTSGRARTIGAPTCGCVLAVRGVHALADGGALEISELDFQMPGGARLEGVGVAPDEKITQTRRDLLARRDAALASALRQIKN